MSITEFLSGVDLTGFSEGTESAIVGGTIRYGLQNGVSGAEILRGLQAQGLGIRRQTFYQLMRVERANIAAGNIPADLALEQIPLDADIPRVPVGRPGTYLSNVKVTYRVSTGPGSYHLEERTISISSREVISPQQAINVTQDIWSQHQVNYPNLSVYDLAYMGTVLHTGKG